MPELPEIETIKNDLNSLLSGKEILSVTVSLPKQVQGDKNKFVSTVKKIKIKQVLRRAKILLMELDSGVHLAFHLKMTGQLIFQNKTGKVSGGGHPINHNLKQLPNKYSHVIFNFADGSKLFFNDTRQFGWVKILDEQGITDLDAKFGPEPLSDSFSEKDFYNLIHKRKRPIKVLLMDPSLIAGIGNIYAMESLYCAGIRPTRRASGITIAESKKLYQCIRKILKLAIEKKGTSSSDYVDAFGRKGSMNDYLKVYLRNGQPCKKCKKNLKLITQASRSTVYCRQCQK